MFELPNPSRQNRHPLSYARGNNFRCGMVFFHPRRVTLGRRELTAPISSGNLPQKLPPSPGIFLEKQSLSHYVVRISLSIQNIIVSHINSYHIYTHRIVKYIFTPLKFHQQNEGLAMPVDIMNIHSYIISVLNPFPHPFYPNPWQHADLRGRGLKQHLLLEPKLFDNKNHQQSFMIWAIYPERSKQWIGVWKPIQNYYSCLSHKS